MQIMISVNYNINNNYASSKKATLKCPKCAEEIALDECFKDKAAENELKTAAIKCTNQGCPWQGPGRFYMVSTNNRYIAIPILCMFNFKLTVPISS